MVLYSSVRAEKLTFGYKKYILKNSFKTKKMNPDQPISEDTPDQEERNKQSNGSISSINTSSTKAEDSTPGVVDSELSKGTHISSENRRIRSKGRLKFIVVVGILLVILFGGIAYAYLGYYMSPTTIWDDSLSNASSSYNRLVNYLNAQPIKHYSGVDAKGSFSVQSGSNHYNGSLDIESYRKTSTASLKLDLGVGSLDVEERSLPVVGASSPNVYLQVNGVNQLGPYTDGYAPLLDKINGQWVEIDHNLISDIASQVSKNRSSKSLFTWSDISSYLVTTEQINKQYLFSTNKSDAVLTVIKNYGQQTVKGINTEHYLVGFNKPNTKSYLYALCNAFVNSAIGSYIKQNVSALVQLNSSTCQNVEDSANTLNSSDTIQVWDNTSTRMPYMIRINGHGNFAANYVAMGLSYNGGNSYPFFIQGLNKINTTTINYSINATLNTANNTFNTTISATYSNGSKVNFNANFIFQPTNRVISVQVPSSSVPLPTVLNNVMPLSPFGASPSMNSGLPLNGL